MKRSISLAAFVAEPFAHPQRITVADVDGVQTFEVHIDGETLEKAVAKAKAK